MTSWTSLYIFQNKTEFSTKICMTAVCQNASSPSTAAKRNTNSISQTCLLSLFTLLTVTTHQKELHSLTSIARPNLKQFKKCKNWKTVSSERKFSMNIQNTILETIPFRNRRHRLRYTFSTQNKLLKKSLMSSWLC